MEETIIQALRLRCPLFSGRVAGAAQFKALQEGAALQVPCAFVVPLDESPQDNQSQNGLRQRMKESFAVIVAISNVQDERGQSAAHGRRQIRNQLWKALLGWQPSEDHDAIEYEGGSLLTLDRARMWYQFEFGAYMEIGPEDGYQETYLNALPHYDGATIKVDVIDPVFDPNIAATGPDSRIEAQITVPKTGNLP